MPTSPTLSCPSGAIPAYLSPQDLALLQGFPATGGDMPYEGPATEHALHCLTISQLMKLRDSGECSVAGGNMRTAADGLPFCLSAQRAHDFMGDTVWAGAKAGLQAGAREGVTVALQEAASYAGDHWRALLRPEPVAPVLCQAT